MRIKIDSDAFDIVHRIKEIDDGYFIVYNTKKSVYELHNKNQINSYCFVIPYNEIDCRLIDLIYKTKVCNIVNIIQEIDKNNTDIENNDINSIKSQSDYMAREIFKFCNNSSRKYDIEKAFTNRWR